MLKKWDSKYLKMANKGLYGVNNYRGETRKKRPRRHKKSLNKSQKPYKKYRGQGRAWQRSFNILYIQNVRHNLHLFINAENAEGAYEQFDKCNFVDRSEWKIFLEAGSQPA